MKIMLTFSFFLTMVLKRAVYRQQIQHKKQPNVVEHISRKKGLLTYLLKSFSWIYFLEDCACFVTLFQHYWKNASEVSDVIWMLISPGKVDILCCRIRHEKGTRLRCSLGGSRAPRLSDTLSAHTEPFPLRDIRNRLSDSYTSNK